MTLHLSVPETDSELEAWAAGYRATETNATQQ